VRKRLVIALAVAASLAACGGGGDSDKSSSKGPKVPDLVGKNWSDATDKLSLAGIPYISKTRAQSQTGKVLKETDYEVCATHPEAGEPLGTDITMEIAPIGKC
jgi:hypothetical protein